MVVVAVLVCSDPECADRLEVVGTPAELDAWACDCGWGCLVLGWPDPLD
jgi:hypothetical protein